MSSNLKVNTILPSVGSNIGLGTNGGNLNVDGGCKVQVGTALTLGHTVGVQFATQNLHSAGFEVNQINASGIITASHFYGSGANLTSLPAANLTGTLPAISGANLTSLPIGGSNALSLNDNVNLNIGTGNDGSLFNSGSYIFLKNHNGNVAIQASGTGSVISLQKYNNSDIGLQYVVDGKIQLNYDNVSMFETESRGAFVKKGNGSDTTFTVGSTDASGVRICLDGDSNGDSYGNDYAFLQHDSSGDFIISADNPAGNSNLIFKSGNSSERARIDDSGRLLIGTTATDNRDGYNSALQVAGTGGDDSSMCIGRYSANTSYPALVFSKSRSSTINSHASVNTGDQLGGIQFQGDDGTRFLVGASIYAQAASPVADYDMATDLIFSTNYGTTSPTKSMTLDQQGRLSKPNQPFVMVTINSRTDWATTGSFLTIPWDTIHGRSTSSNVGSHFDTSNHRFTAPVAGRYLFVLSMNIIGDNIMKHNINGASVSKGEYRMTQLVWDHIDASFIYDMNANDYYTTTSRLYDGSGKRWNGGNNSSEGWDTLSIYLLG